MDFNKAEFITSYGLSSQLPESEKFEIAFSGRSNVGKSSTINKLFNRKALARVSAVPGKTATINFYSVDQTTDFVDLPGYGYAKVAKTEKERWSLLIEKYFNNDRRLMLVVALIDMRHPPMKLDVDMINYLVECELPFIVVLTKADKLNKSERAQRLAGFKSELPFSDQIEMFVFSAKTGEGAEEIRQVISEACSEDLTQENDDASV